MNKKFRFAALMTAVSVLFGCSAMFVDRVASAAQEWREPPLIILDAGHGGFDGGALASDGTCEKDINLAVVLRLDNMLNLLGFKTLLIRDSDVSVETRGDTVRARKNSDIMNRYSVMKKHPRSIYLCIHQNKYSAAYVHGAQIFYSPNDDGSKRLAGIIQTNIASRLQLDNKREIKRCTKSVYLIYNATTTAVLIECGFLSNPTDLSNLKNGEYQSRLSLVIACALAQYTGNS